MRDLWDAEAERNNVLPISDGLVDRFGGFIPPAWPAGPSRTFRPGGGPSPTSRSRCCGAASTSPPTSTPTATAPTASSSPSATGSGATPLYLVGGRAHFTFARAADALELATPSALAAGRHESPSPTRSARAARRAAWSCSSTGPRSTRPRSRACCPLAVQHGGAGLRLGWDSGFPVSARYAPPAPFDGTVHGVRVDTPGSLRPDPADEVRAALHAD